MENMNKENFIRVNSINVEFTTLDEQPGRFHARVGEPANATKPNSEIFIKELYFYFWSPSQYSEWLAIMRVKSNGTKDIRFLDGSRIDTFNVTLLKEETDIKKDKR